MLCNLFANCYIKFVKQVTYTKQALKTLRRMPANTTKIIVGKIKIYAATPEKLAANVSKLQGVEGFRLRVGDWRVIFTEDLKMIAIIKIGPRGDIYK